MPLSLEIESGTGVVIGTVTGTMSLEDTKQAAETIWANPEWRGKAVLWDLRGATVQLQAAEVRQLAEFILGGQPDAPPRVAFVPGRDADYGLARMFEVFREHVATEVRVFRDWDEALAWVRQASVRSAP